VAIPEFRLAENAASGCHCWRWRVYEKWESIRYYRQRFRGRFVLFFALPVRTVTALKSPTKCRHRYTSTHYAVRNACRPISSAICCRRTYLGTFPVTVMGNRSRKRTCRGILKRAIWPRQNSRISATVAAYRAQMMQGRASRVPRIRNAHHLHVLHFRMAVEKFLDLARVYVLATADHHVLRAPDDVAIAFSSTVRGPRCASSFGSIASRVFAGSSSSPA